jgi:hypothetical protein
LFIDAENILVGALSAGFSRPIASLMERVREQGFLMSAEAYGDWTRYPCSQFLREFQLNTVEMTQLPTSAAGKNTADINLAVDAIEMALSPSAPDTVVLAAADRDFVPLVQKLRRYGKEVIGIGVRGSVSRELEQVCNAFLMLDDIIPEAAPEPAPSPAPEAPAVSEEVAAEEKLDVAGAFRLLARATDDVIRSGRDALGAHVMDRLRELHPDFSFRQHGFDSFREFALAAEAQKAVQVTLSVTGDLRLAPYVEEPDEVQPELRFDTAQEACESYRTILLTHKKVPIIRWADRKRLVAHLWEVLGAEPAGLTINEMGSELIWHARSQGLQWPDRAIQKLLHTLNIALCFTDGGQARYIQELFHTRLHAATSLEEALAAMHEVYARGVRMAEPHVPLNDWGLAALFYDDEAEHHIAEVRSLIERITGRPAAPRTSMERAFEQARDEPR